MVTHERRERYVQAIFCGEDGGVGEAALHLVMAVADAEQAELRAEIERWKRYAEGMAQAWREADRRAKAAEAKVARVEAAIADLSDFVYIDDIRAALDGAE